MFSPQARLGVYSLTIIRVTTNISDFLLDFLGRKAKPLIKTACPYSTRQPCFLQCARGHVLILIARFL